VTARIIDGRAIARSIEEEVRAEIERLRFRPGLTAIRVGSDPASEIYVRNKAKKAHQLGLRGDERILPDSITERDLLDEVQRLNEDADIDGILVQLPLPKHIDSRKIIDAVDPAKDVDGFHPMNVGRLHLGREVLAPCTPAGCVRLIESTGVPIEGKHAVIVGRSDIVGKPMAALLLQRNATVTVAHSRTPDLAAVVKQGDIVVAAVGKPRLIQAEMLKRGAVVIDVGINRIPENNRSVLVGDVDFGHAREVAGWITPVPGGVGPMTIAMLMRNTLTAAMWRRR
jgi:methylenetetrahydrofolate dehydrogenase (NADP+)/methenyltetrahydrofolate cyclohydrolase